MKKMLINFDLVISCTAMTALVFYTFFGVIMRYVIGSPITWGEEFQLTCFVIIVFFAAGAGFRMKSHVAIDVVVDLFPPKVQKVIEAVVYVLSIFVLGYLMIQSYVLVKQMFVTGRTTDILEIPFYLIYASFPIGCVLMIVNYSVCVFLRLTGREGDVW